MNVSIPVKDYCISPQGIVYRETPTGIYIYPDLSKEVACMDAAIRAQFPPGQATYQGGVVTVFGEGE